jgi:Kdo2-lipid IVA lauroyltransferase/acyltransferase
MPRKNKPEKYIKHRFSYLVILACIGLIRAVPRRVGMAVMRAGAGMFYRMPTVARKRTIRHLTLAFGNEKTPEEIQRIGRDVFRHFAMAGVDAIRIPRMIEDGMDQFITAENLHILDRALAEEKGVIVLTGHFGNWELMGAYMARKGYPIKAIGAPLDNPWMDRLVVEMRNRAGYANIMRGEGARAIIRALKAGHVLAMLIDQDTKVNGVFVDFFGHKAHTAVGPVVLAQRFEIPIIPVFMRMKPDLTYHIECFSAIPLAATGDKEKDILKNTQKCSDVYEAVIRRYPEQWAWMHRRWRKKP